MSNPKVQHKKAIKRNLSPEFEKSFTVKVATKPILRLSLFLRVAVVTLGALCITGVINNWDSEVIKSFSISILIMFSFYLLIDLSLDYRRIYSTSQIKNRAAQILRTSDATLSDVSSKDINLLYESEGLVNIVEIRSESIEYRSYRVANDSLVRMDF